MSDRDGLLRAIIADPEDDAARLVYSDWLDEHGDAPRAEFIRVQVRRAGMLQGDPGWDELTDRARELHGYNVTRWVGELPVLPDLAWGTRQFYSFHRDAEFPRGFVEGVAAKSFTAFTGAFDRVRQAIPLRRLTVDTRGAYKRLTASPCLGSLTELDLRNSRLGDDGLAALVEAPHLGRLRALRLEANNLRVAGVRALAASSLMGQLTTLDLRVNRVGPAGARALAESPGSAGLTALDLYIGFIGTEGALALAGSPHLAGLVRLGLEYNEIGDDGVRALAGSPFLGRLRWLDLALNRVTPAGHRALLESPTLAGLRFLRLCDNPPPEPAVLEALRRRFGVVDLSLDSRARALERVP